MKKMETGANKTMCPGGVKKQLFDGGTGGDAYHKGDASGSQCGVRKFKASSCMGSP
jgi:hypothetical protein